MLYYNNANEIINNEKCIDKHRNKVDKKSFLHTILQVSGYWIKKYRDLDCTPQTGTPAPLPKAFLTTENTSHP